MGVAVEAEEAGAPLIQESTAETGAPEIWGQVIKPPVGETLHVEGLSFVYPPEPLRFREEEPTAIVVDEKANSANRQVAGLAAILLSDAKERARNPKYVRPTAPPTGKPLIPRNRRKALSKDPE